MVTARRIAFFIRKSFMVVSIQTHYAPSYHHSTKQPGSAGAATEIISVWYGITNFLIAWEGSCAAR